jgi:signal transduction histidine kinase
MNLIQNAIHAIEKEGNIWIKTKLVGDQVVVEVKDDGCGIPKENMGKIFDPFFTSKEVGKGTGLGLSISYGIGEKPTGKIEVESEVGKGTTFRVKIPVNVPLS